MEICDWREQRNTLDIGSPISYSFVYKVLANHERGLIMAFRE